MACKRTSWLFMVCMLSAWMAVHGAVPVGAPVAMDCSNALMNLADCLTFVEAGSNVRKPEGNCCAGLKKVAKGQVGCLCEAFKSGADFGVKINMTKALSLPHVCGVNIPSISICKIAGGPAFAPAPSPGGFPGKQVSEVPAQAPAPETHSSSSVIHLPVKYMVVRAIALLFFFV
ncbi:non-specific lipid transfer protein GPI-anchored 31-like [Dioscorea cayenensis subsp. rotundata]|uniref:Non-specific lipid transfer protein GPI-anchored 31-like n=1 Tax=Dioscorea cayennensis subsp. rotundata TaxID=55577 RepID=A0AB40CZQ8_DIOCR|nr:non-specific lipid transfer protein GPI-anchored 31-like [Dioscorea cayenensis subsp. rotundata]